ncbi:MAG TPA: Zn-dependent protease, partial [Legionella sp.]|nr:Zn-dependent protease [Legionella sp.]
MILFILLRRLKTQTGMLLQALLFIYLTLPTHAWAFSPYSNNELDQLEKEFIQQINQSN